MVTLLPVEGASVLETASSTCADTLMSRPCSSQVYQVTPTPASSATALTITAISLLMTPVTDQLRTTRD
ncbi:hypothetical protein AB0H36_19045 [Kribbella sp. NPDC050820]|uniref:hypothetical protein n=1 Tax=Kribbella sp. NPDC050820 TaxID=3155408 RepID=UPI0033D6EFE7